MSNANKTPHIILGIRSKYPTMIPSMKKIAEFLFKDYIDASYLSITEIANQSGVSESTVTRFIKEIGYSNFKSFQVDLARSVVVDHDRMISSYSGLTKGDESQSICEKVIMSNIDALQNTSYTLNFAEISNAADSILKSKNLIIYANGRSAIAASSGRLRFYRLGINCFFYGDPHEQSVSSSLVSEGDTVIGISNSGRTVSVVRSVMRAKEMGAKVIAITSFQDSVLAKLSDICLLTASNEPEISVMEPTSSAISQIVVLDCLYMATVLKMPEDALCFFRTNELELINSKTLH